MHSLVAHRNLASVQLLKAYAILIVILALMWKQFEVLTNIGKVCENSMLLLKVAYQLPLLKYIYMKCLEGSLPI